MNAIVSSRGRLEFCVLDLGVPDVTERHLTHEKQAGSTCLTRRRVLGACTKNIEEKEVQFFLGFCKAKKENSSVIAVLAESKQPLLSAFLGVLSNRLMNLLKI